MRKIGILSLLFAFILMKQFGVWANLMSLGAIDFGIIVDGAVIIVEGMVFHIHQRMKKTTTAIDQSEMDEIAYESASTMMNSAFFGQLIILIVFTPILFLTGVEGKMFRPMAFTFGFAVLGAIILCLTYVPMISALFLKPAKNQNSWFAKFENKIDRFSDKIMSGLNRGYVPLLNFALRFRAGVVIGAVALLLIAGFIFSNMGGEFIPKFNEGDIAFQALIKPGSSLTESIEASKKLQNLINEFPEVKTVISRIGVAEIPTDPMPIEAGDMMVILSPKSEWTKASGREELAAVMKESLSIIPNATFSFQQPIQMRFNELLTGAKQDVVIKIYGEDLNILSDLAGNVGSKIKSVEGVEDLYVEEVTGLPQINIQMNRDKISQYGMNIEDVNNAIETAFAGTSAGLVYEGERRFDLVVRLDKNYRTDITDVQNLYVSTPQGNQIPLSQVANISFEPGPVQIQRDNAKRRIIVGFNVRDRDVQSIIEDIKQIMNSKVDMPAGYYVTYGGQFQNLQEANQRLIIALPIALLLILVLLFFTFGSMKQSLLIFTAIPLSAIGGVFALIIRDLPFSISAGIGFIALFGVAVLNGIVLVAEFNRLDKEGVSDIYERVIKGTRVRLRPVLMTATVAALGFLPMALSNSSGAEVQRPLATVVIGGLITATALTLIVLPVLYIYFTDRKAKFNFRSKKIVTTLIVIAGLFFPAMQLQAQETSMVQEREITLQQAIEMALKNNNRIKIAQYEIEVEEKGKYGAITIPRTEFTYQNGEFNTPKVKDNQYGVTQRINFPTVYTSQFKLAKARVSSSKQLKVIEENDLIADVKAAYFRVVFLMQNKQLLQRQDSLYGNLNRSSSMRYESGESTKLESVTSATQSMQIKNKLQQNEADMRIAEKQLQVVLNTNDEITITDSELVRREIDLDIERQSVEQSPFYVYLKQQLEVRKRETNVERNKVLPDIMFGYNSQTFNGGQNSGLANSNFNDDDRFSFFQVGLSIPIFPGGHRAKIQAAKIEEDIAQSQIELNKTQLQGELQNLLQEYYKLQGTLDYYQNEALPQAELIIDNSEKSFKSGDVSYTQYLQNLTLANSIQTEYLNTLYQYNQSIIVIEALLGL